MDEFIFIKTGTTVRKEPNVKSAVLATFFDENREYVPLDKISPEMQMAQVAIEDHRFFEHGAIDLQSIIRAAIGNAGNGSISGGGSTLTQQYVKQVRIQLCDGETTCIEDAQAPSMDRKIQEMRYAIALEQTLTKNEILERYLNIGRCGWRWDARALRRAVWRTSTLTPPPPPLGTWLRPRCWPGWSPRPLSAPRSRRPGICWAVPGAWRRYSRSWH